MIYFAIDEDGTALATCMAKPMEGSTWELCKLGSNKNHKHTGSGSMVFEAAMNWAIQHGAGRLFLILNSKLIIDFMCSDIINYTALVQGPMFSIDEVKGILDDERVTEEDKIKLLSMTTELISVKARRLSDVVFKSILENHFDTNDLSYLAQEYERFNDECQTAIYKVMVAHKAHLNSIAEVCPKLLLLRLFRSTSLSLVEKANVLDVLLQNKKSNDLIAELLIATGEDMLARLFSQERSRMSSIENNAGHVRLLTVLKENKIIEDFSEDEEGKQLKIKR